jgi:hypothetical protein
MKYIISFALFIFGAATASLLFYFQNSGTMPPQIEERSLVCSASEGGFDKIKIISFISKYNGEQRNFQRKEFKDGIVMFSFINNVGPSSVSITFISIICKNGDCSYKEYQEKYINEVSRFLMREG